MSTSRARQRGRRITDGFTALELLLGLALAVLVVVAIAPLWLSLEKKGVREADRVITVMQGRVAIARFERDLRLASAGECPFSTAAAVLEATPSQVVVLSRGADDGRLRLVEWEVISGRLMRRWGWCPSARPTTYENVLYLDHKTMLEGILQGSGFCYEMGGREERGPISAAELSRIEAVTLSLSAEIQGEVCSAGLSTTAPVGR